MSIKGKTEKTKASENVVLSDNESVSSDGEVTLDSIDDEDVNSISQYLHDPSIMKKNKPFLGAGKGALPHPVIDRLTAKPFATDLTKIRNVSPAKVHY